MSILDIAEVTQHAGVPASTLRYYEEKGLIVSTGRRGLRRQFHADVLERLALIALGRAAGFSLDEIREILTDTSDDWHQIVEAKIAETIARRAELDTMLSLLEAIQECGCDAVAACPSRGDW